MKVAYIVRGYPGLSKVIPSVVVNTMFRTLYGEKYQSIFFSCLNGYVFLNNAGYTTNSIISDSLVYREYCWTPFSIDSNVLIEKLGNFQPDLVVIDGEPVAIEIISEVLSIPVLAIVSSMDLFAENSKFLRYYLNKADVICVHGLETIPQEDLQFFSDRVKLVFPINTLVRPNIFQEHLQRRNGNTSQKDWIRLVAILGGGCQNVGRELWNDTMQIAESLLQVITPEETDSLTLLCSDVFIYDRLSHRKTIDIDLELISSPIDNTALLLESDVVIGRLGLNLAAEVLALGCRAILVQLTWDESIKNIAKQISSYSPTVQVIPLSQMSEKFSSCFRECMKGKNIVPTWIPGNLSLARKLPEILQRLNF